MKREIKKITIMTPSKNTQKKDTIKKLAGKPDIISNFIQDKFKNIQRNELSSWVIPAFFLKNGNDTVPNKIEKIITDIQTNRKTNQLLSKKHPKLKNSHKESTDSSIVNSNFKPDKNDTQQYVESTSLKCVKNPLDIITITPEKEKRSGQIKTRKEGRLYSKEELKDLCNILIELYNKGNNKKITYIMQRLTRNQCNQILNYKKLIQKSWTNAPMPLLRFLVYQTISCPRIKYRIL